MSNDSLTGFMHREIVALFQSPEALVEAADALDAKGIGWTQLSILGTGTEAEAAALADAGFRPLREVLEGRNVPSGVPLDPADLARARSAPVASAIYVYATLADGAANEESKTILTPIVAAAAAAATEGAGSTHSFLLFRLLDKPAPLAEETIARGGLVLWALLGKDENQEPEISHVLRRSGGELLRIQDVPFEREIASDPLHRP